jgi:hypothetical protein
VNFADSNFFQVFDFPFVYGDPSTVIERAKEYCACQLEESKRIFGEVDPVGRTL